MTLNFGSFPTFLTSSLDINVFRLSAVISSKLFKLIVFPLFPSTVSAPCAWLFYGSSNNAGTLRAWPLCPLILEWNSFLNDRKSSCEVNSTLLVRVLKLRFCAVLRLKRWSVGCSAAVSGWSLWEWWQPVTAAISCERVKRGWSALVH